MDEENKEIIDEKNDIYEEVPKKKVNKSKIVIAVLSIMILGLLALCVYNNYQLKLERDKQSNTSNISENTESNNNSESNNSSNIDLDINSGLVHGLYNLVNIDWVNMDWKQENGVTAEEMTYLDKFSLAINQVKTDDVNCLDYKDLIIKEYGTSASLLCGDGIYNNIDFDPTTKEWSTSENQIPYTDLYKEKDIKSIMHQIFGKDYYERKNKVEDFAYDYLYIAKEEGYIKVYPPKGGTRQILEEELVSAKIINDELVLISKGKGERNVTLTYTFKYNSSDRSYYFDKLEIK